MYSERWARIGDVMIAVAYFSICPLLALGLAWLTETLR